jgi:hypothetical protein
MLAVSDIEHGVEFFEGEVLGLGESGRREFELASSFSNEKRNNTKERITKASKKGREETQTHKKYA